MFLPWKWRGSALTLGYGQQHSVWFGIKEKQIFLERMLCGLWCVFLGVALCFVFEKPCLGFSALLFFADNLCGQWPSPVLRAPTHSTIQDAHESWTALLHVTGETRHSLCSCTVSFHWAEWSGNILVAVWLYGSSCQLKSKATFFFFSENKASVICKCLLQWELSRV